ncbi:glycosyltransferase family 4 protein [Azospirillum sp.]|uniref:glycosyltransferase family 4 protein n=1 Tax=Azospirillum sp. TaxID=34012 RepID=UPI003D723347
MKLLFVHQNTPGQYKHLAPYMASIPGNEVVFIGKAKRELTNVLSVVYAPSRKPAKETHHYLRGFEDQVLHGQAVARVGIDLQRRGFVPDVICAHPGWGEALFLKDVFPSAKLLAFCEFFYRSRGSDVGFDPAHELTIDAACRIRCKNATLLTSLDAADWGISPTEWQRSQHPDGLHSKISVVHDGVDTEVCRPDESATVTLPDGRVLSRADEVVTYIARNLEPYRGFPTFMRAAEEICRRRPNAQILVIGDDDVSYGARPTGAPNWRTKMLEEVRLDPARVHFLGRVPYTMFLRVVQVSRAHIYLTYPFVLSWSMLEAMACGALIIGSNTPPVTEVIEEGRNGLLVDFFDPKGVADRVDEALDAPHRFEAVRAAARRTVLERYDLRSVCLPAQVRLIEDLYAGRTPPLHPTVGVPVP